MRIKKYGLALLLFMSFLFIPFGEASAEAKLDVNATIGIENKVKYGTGLPLVITVTNNGDDFSGDLVLDAEVDYSIGSALVYPFDIAAGETKTLHLYLEGYSDNYNNNGTKPDYIHFFKGGVDKGNKIGFSGKKSFSPSMYDPSAQFVYTLTENSDRLSAFLRLRQYATYEVEVFHLNQLKNYSLPEDGRELELANVVAVDEFALSDLSDKQQQALLDWVQKGGTLLIGASDQVEASAGIFAQYLPLKLSNERVAVSKDTLKSLSAGGNFSKDIEVYKATENDGSKRFMADGDTILVSETTVGSGRVLQTTFSLGDDPLASMDGYGKLINEILDLSNPIMIGKNNYSDSKFSMQQEWRSINELFPSFEVSITGLVVLIIIYILVVGPILYFVLKRLDRREAAWWIIPALAVVISLALFIIGGRDRILQPQIQQMALFKVNEDSSLTGYYTNTLLTNRGGDFTFDTDANTTVVGAKKDDLNISTGNLHEQSYVKQHATGSTITLKNLNYWSVQSVVGQTNIEDAGKLDIQLTLENGKLQGTIDNNFPFALKDVTVVSGFRHYSLGEIEANGTLKVSEDIKTKVLPGVSMGTLNYSQPQTKADLLPKRLEYMDYSASLLLQDERLPMITAWSEEAIVPITLDGNAEMDTVSKFVQSFKPTIIMSGAVDFSMNDFEIELNPIDGMGYAELVNSSTNMWFIGEGSYEGIFRVASGIELSNINWTEIEIQHDTDMFDIEILNKQTNDYESIADKKQKLTEKVGQYINDDGEITLKITRAKDLTGMEVLLPTLKLKGEVQE